MDGVASATRLIDVLRQMVFKRCCGGQNDSDPSWMSKKKTDSSCSVVVNGPIAVGAVPWMLQTRQQASLAEGGIAGDDP